MSSTVFPASGTWPSSLQTLSMISTQTNTRDIDADIRLFWSSFPCPPPWKPRLLIEVNASRLNPIVGRTVQTFLAGKCRIRHVLAGLGEDYHIEPDEIIQGVDLRPTDTTGNGLTLGHPATSNHQWCDTTCQLSFGCAVLFVMSLLIIALVICVTRNKVRHKMAAARPSRQQLQLSTSTSDAVNCTEFSNLEVHGDDDIISPPFRHRGLPHLPSIACHPSCDSKWNCANCASCHPLMRVNPQDLYYSPVYSTDYETLDDYQDDISHSQENKTTQGDTTPTIPDSRDHNLSCIPYQVSPTSISTVLLRPRACESVVGNTFVAETGFNGEDLLGNCSNPAVPKYFELEQSCALSDLPNSRINEQNLINSFGLNAPFYECYNANSCESAQSSVATVSGLHGLTPLRSCGISLVHRNSNPRCRMFEENSAWRNTDPSNSEDLSQTAESDSQNYNKRHSSRIPFNEGSICYFRDRKDNINQTTSSGVPSSSQQPYSSQVCSSVSTFLRDIPNNYLCSTCQPAKPAFCVKPQRYNPASVQLVSSPSFQGATVGPDLLKEAFHPSKKNDVTTDSTSASDARDANCEAPLKKPVLALHPQYFAKTYVA